MSQLLYYLHLSGSTIWSASRLRSCVLNDIDVDSTWFHVRLRSGDLQGPGQTQSCCCGYCLRIPHHSCWVKYIATDPPSGTEADMCCPCPPSIPPPAPLWRTPWFRRHGANARPPSGGDPRIRVYPAEQSIPHVQRGQVPQTARKNHPEIFAANTEGNVPIFWLGVRR